MFTHTHEIIMQTQIRKNPNCFVIFQDELNLEEKLKTKLAFSIDSN